MMIIDSHCDTIKYAYKNGLTIEDEILKFNIRDAKKPMIQMMAVYISPEEAINGFETAGRVIEKFDEQVNKFKDQIVQIYEYSDIEKVMAKNKIGVILTSENGSIISSKLENIDFLYEKGMRVMSIVWNYSNELGTGALETIDTGLTELGKRYIRKLNNKNIIVDVSHASEKTFWDTIKESTKPVVATHSCVYKICNHPRNLKDDQIKQIAKMGGVVGITFCSPFLNSKKRANVKDVVKHIRYIKDLVGIDYVGIGSDFDGVSEEDMLEDIKGTKNIDILVKELKNEGFTEKELDKIMWRNWLRVLERYWKNK